MYMLHGVLIGCHPKYGIISRGYDFQCVRWWCPDLGDFNASSGADHDTWPSCIGQFSVGKMIENGQRLLELCTYHDLCIANSYFRTKPQHKDSWRHPRSKHWHQYTIFTPRPWRTKREGWVADLPQICASVRKLWRNIIVTSRSFGVTSLFRRLPYDALFKKTRLGYKFWQRE